MGLLELFCSFGVVMRWFEREFEQGFQRFGGISDSKYGARKGEGQK